MPAFVRQKNTFDLSAYYKKTSYIDTLYIFTNKLIERHKIVEKEYFLIHGPLHGFHSLLTRWQHTTVSSSFWQ